MMALAEVSNRRGMRPVAEEAAGKFRRIARPLSGAMRPCAFWQFSKVTAPFFRFCQLFQHRVTASEETAHVGRQKQPICNPAQDPQR